MSRYPFSDKPTARLQYGKYVGLFILSYFVVIALLTVWYVATGIQGAPAMLILILMICAAITGKQFFLKNSSLPTKNQKLCLAGVLSLAVWVVSLVPIIFHLSQQDSATETLKRDFQGLSSISIAIVLMLAVLLSYLCIYFGLGQGAKLAKKWYSGRTG